MKLDTSYPLHNFIVVTLDYVNDEPATQVLQRSAGFCKMSTSWEYKGSNICFVMVDGQVRIDLVLRSWAALQHNSVKTTQNVS